MSLENFHCFFVTLVIIMFFQVTKHPTATKNVTSSANIDQTYTPFSLVSLYVTPNISFAGVSPFNNYLLSCSAHNQNSTGLFQVFFKHNGTTIAHYIRNSTNSKNIVSLK